MGANALSAQDTKARYPNSTLFPLFILGSPNSD